MLDFATDLVTRLGHWAYVVIFAVAAGESAAFLGLVVPGASLVLISGFLANQGVLDLDALIVTVAIGATVGDNIGYKLGRRVSRPWLLHQWARFGLNEEPLDKADAFFRRHGGKSVFLGRFVGFARALVPFIAGSVRMPYTVFLVYDALGAALWASLVVLVGYFGGELAGRWLGRAAGVVAGVVLFALALVWAWQWMAGHEAQVTARWQRIKQGPTVAATLKRLAPQIAWLRHRLSRGSYFGLQLTSAVLLFVGAAWLFGGVTEDVLSGDPLTVFDRKIEAWLATHNQHGVTAFMSAVSWLHTWPVAVIAIVFLVYLVVRRRWRWAVIGLCAVPGGMLLNTGIKLALHRERPTLSGLSAALQTYSFPSGHTIAAALIYGLVAMYLVSRTERWDRRVSIVLSAGFLVALVALSRMYLGVHYFSDVLAAMAEGVAWLALCHTAVTTWWHRRMSSRRFSA